MSHDGNVINFHHEHQRDREDFNVFERQPDNLLQSPQRIDFPAFQLRLDSFVHKHVPYAHPQKLLGSRDPTFGSVPINLRLFITVLDSV